MHALVAGVVHGSLFCRQAWAVLSCCHAGTDPCPQETRNVTHDAIAAMPREHHAVRHLFAAALIAVYLSTSVVFVCWTTSSPLLQLQTDADKYDESVNLGVFAPIIATPPLTGSPSSRALPTDALVASCTHSLPVHVYASFSSQYTYVNAQFHKVRRGGLGSQASWI